MTDREAVNAWLARYIEAWTSYDREQIRDLFAEDATYRFHPFDEPIRGREAIVESWFDEPDEARTFEAEYRPVAVDGDTAVAIGSSSYNDSPEGEVKYVAGAFPSACGKTNLSMMIPTLPDWKVETIGDDIAWMRFGEDGRLHAINPEAGFFGVAPGTGEVTNPTAVNTVWGNTIFTNVALRDDGDVWWEGLTETAPSHLIDWQGNDWTPDSGRPAAHPNSRFTVAAAQCPSISEDWEAFGGVPIDAILFGGRRATNVPLVAQARSWKHGVFMGATISSEKTAAAEGTVGELRRDPFAMLPFCGYNMADYWGHWLKVGKGLGVNAPAIFQVNWFRKGDDGSFLWPGFGENSRVIEWIVRRIEGKADAVDTPIGLLPAENALNLDGLDLSANQVEQLFRIDNESWLKECDLTEEYFEKFGARVPPALYAELASVRYNLRG